MIRGEDISVKLGGKTILREISLEVAPGEYTALLGPNGAGKSTLLKVLALLLKPSSGRVIIKDGHGKEIENIKRKIGFLSHRSFLYDRLTAWENLKFYGNLFQVANLGDRVDQLMEQVELTYFLHEPVYTFSRGMVQRLAIARALLHDPEILYLDEPFTGLDQKGGEILAGILADLHNRGKTVFMVTHNFTQGLDLVDRVLILKNGVKIYDQKVTGAGTGDLQELYARQVGME